MSLIDPKKGPEWFKENARDIVTNLTANLGHFPNCCSTGIITNVDGICYNPSYDAALSPGKYPKQQERINAIKSAKYIHEIVRACCRGGTVFWSREMANWFVLSLIYMKTVFGMDDVKPQTGYSNYKAANIVMLDRLNEDKDKGFRFSYNTHFSCDHFMEYMEQHGSQFGTVQISPAVPGGHGARVRGLLFTGDHDALTKWHSTHFEEVRSHALMWCEHHQGAVGEAVVPVDAVAAMF